MFDFRFGQAVNALKSCIKTIETHRGDASLGLVWKPVKGVKVSL
jgi:hypothetical protein